MIFETSCLFLYWIGFDPQIRRLPLSKTFRNLLNLNIGAR
ncbi:hypothetical protein BSLA_01f2378 [Burkholderia stabilis]|nr:hypothetical protein BSLA_01f2378 [Burkholderia stabilis]